MLRNKIDKRIYVWKIDLSLFRETTFNILLPVFLKRIENNRTPIKSSSLSPFFLSFSLVAAHLERPGTNVRGRGHEEEERNETFSVARSSSSCLHLPRSAKHRTRGEMQMESLD